MNKAHKEKDSLLNFGGIKRPQNLPLYHGLFSLKDPGKDDSALSVLFLRLKPFSCTRAMIQSVLAVLAND